MKLRLALAEAVGAASTWVLKNIFHRPAANFPGKVGLYADAQLISDLRSRLRTGSILVVGTNGKTTVTNMLADAFEAAGKSVVCNRTGANLDSGVATSLLQTESADWGIFESDELWLAKVLPQLQSDYVVLLNLFRDQLDRAGEIEHVQRAIADALACSPDSTLVYNVDDPMCQAVARSVANRRISFGIDDDLGLPQNTVSDVGMCQECDALLDYDWRQYGQLGAYRCPNCGFKRESPDCSVRDVDLSAEQATLTFQHDALQKRMTIPFSEAYMLYNALAVLSAADCCGMPLECACEAIRSFDPQNGRLQHYRIGGYRVLLNLAKNPTGFNQNLRIVEAAPGPKAVAFFINDKEADGRDVSWLWDVDFQELANADGVSVFAGGIRRNDLQVRLKYAGIDALLVDDAADFLAKASALGSETDFYLIANYTALPGVKATLDTLDRLPDFKPLPGMASQVPTAALSDERLTIMHLYPDLLNLYGDGGNVAVLATRARMRGIDARVVRVELGEKPDFTQADIAFLGGGPDREQRLASRALMEQVEAIRRYVEDDGVLLAICGGYQLLGNEWVLGDDVIPGLGIVEITTGRADGGSHNRLVGNIVLESPLATHPVVGYENHAGRTYLGSGCKPFGTVKGGHGKGNNDRDKADGVLYRNVVGTYLHGPLLAKNPEIADCLIERALAQRALKEGRDIPVLPPLDDAVELAANEFMCAKLGMRK